MFKQLYKHNDKLYLINRKIPIDYFTKEGTTHMGFVKCWRDWLKCDNVLKLQTHFLFVETIEDIEFEEINNEIKNIEK